ncbi:tRNA (guanosine(46)-N7)-methyltransferase TrmB [Williamsia sp.]|uniref:tRNA (guanosine(46)-N7)-methyltransferase TrmB n=1 Tax=Williamsia sp. TaxID=1872085 RepID=UPI002F940EC7
MRDYGRVTSPRSNPNPDTDEGVDTESDAPAVVESALDDDAQRRERARLYPRVTSFRSRRGALTAAQQANWERLWPLMGRDVSDSEVIDPAAWFGRTAPLILEIGSGTGTSTAAMAAVEPDHDVIAVEVYRPGIAQLLGAIGRGDLENIRVVRGDAVIVLKNMLTPASLTGVRVFFPDPWPKARHHKRRLLQPSTIELIAGVLMDGGALHIATDHAEYAESIAEVLAAQTLLVPTDKSVPFSTERPVTKFEGRAAVEGRPVTEFVLTRVPR